MSRLFTVMIVSLALCLMAGINAQADSLLLSDNFDTQGTLNQDLGTRQSGLWAPSTWTLSTFGGGGGYGMYNYLSLGGSGVSWVTAVSDNNGASLVGRKYTIAATMDMSSAKPADPQG